MRARLAWRWIAAVAALLACAGCGFKGPLYLPERNATVVTPPAQSPPNKKKQNASPVSPPASPAPSPP
jgi:predicted small lipoprotein YifL